MKISVFFLALLHSAFLALQEPVPPKYSIHTKKLCQGDMMHLGSKGIKFKKVVSDSRCPRGGAITCIWAGEVKVLVEFYEDGKLKGEKVLKGSNISINDHEVVAGTGISIVDFFNQEKDLKISSIAVYPYPDGKSDISANEYSLDLQISEKMVTD
ncbi:hypothetical protein GCM10023115_35640 [Pontixanthobacter gangjinensis]|uniref:Secreted protein n=1 Tax=Christiangramia aestuarii TaxID=1028746 RepID=A0A7K1LR80_9FLAO|nr:hypothetical protein [Christiangramia aestuarii]MUP43268.1 hypothetical protein [Christiangramia aestuarii]